MSSRGKVKYVVATAFMFRIGTVGWCEVLLSNGEAMRRHVTVTNSRVKAVM